MLFLAFLSMVVLSAHILSPLGALFMSWLNSQNPHLLTGLSPHSRYAFELTLLHFPSVLIVMVFWLRLHLFDHLPQRHPNAAKFLLVGLGTYFLFVIGRNTEGSFSDTLNNYLNVGLLFSRAALLMGTLKLLLNLEGKASGAAGASKAPPGAGPGGGGPSDDDAAALAALMGMMGGGPPGGGKGPPRRPKR